jgi:glycosyltransferase involved in cell wall biosynthesis
MKISSISTNDGKGGSSRSAIRIHQNLELLNVNSKVFVGWKLTNENNIRILGNKFTRILDFVLQRVLNKLGLNNLFNFSSLTIFFNSFFRYSSILQIYNLHNFYFGFLNLFFVSENKLIVYRLSDMWSFTGHCSFSFDCEKWKTGCGKCPNLSTYPPLEIDNTSFHWKIKRYFFQKRNKIIIVAPSSWMYNLVSKSPIFLNKKIVIIPNGVDTRYFYPDKTNDLRKEYGIKENSLIFTFVSESINDSRKGIDIILDSLKILSGINSEDFVLLFIGKEINLFSKFQSVRILQTGFVSNQDKLRELYSMSDVLLCPSLSDNLPNTVLESMACQCPVLGFPVGGLLDVIENGINGFFTDEINSKSLVKSIIDIISDKKKLLEIRANALNTVKDKYSAIKEAQAYIKLYNENI